MNVSWWALVTEPITSSSPLSDALDEAEVVSMATVGSGSELESDWLDGEQEGAGPVSSEVGSVAMVGSGLPIGSVWLLCSWLLFIMLFMALCISSSMRCFSRLGMRPKRTAEQGGDNHFRMIHLFFKVLTHKLEIVSVVCSVFTH